MDTELDQAYFILNYAKKQGPTHFLLIDKDTNDDSLKVRYDYERTIIE
jgi:hypothetical protein